MAPVPATLPSPTGPCRADWLRWHWSKSASVSRASRRSGPKVPEVTSIWADRVLQAEGPSPPASTPAQRWSASRRHSETRASLCLLADVGPATMGPEVSRSTRRASPSSTALCPFDEHTLIETGRKPREEVEYPGVRPDQRSTPIVLDGSKDLAGGLLGAGERHLVKVVACGIWIIGEGSHAGVYSRVAGDIGLDAARVDSCARDPGALHLQFQA